MPSLRRRAAVVLESDEDEDGERGCTRAGTGPGARARSPGIPLLDKAWPAQAEKVSPMVVSCPTESNGGGWARKGDDDAILFHSAVTECSTGSKTCVARVAREAHDGSDSSEGSENATATTAASTDERPAGATAPSRLPHRLAVQTEQCQLAEEPVAPVVPVVPVAPVAPGAPAGAAAVLPSFAMGRCASMAWEWLGECPNRWSAQLLSTHLHELVREHQCHSRPSAREAVDDVRRIFVRECQSTLSPAGLPSPLPRFVVVADIGGHRVVMHSSRSELIMALTCFRPDLVRERALRIEESVKRMSDAVHQSRAAAAAASVTAANRLSTATAERNHSPLVDAALAVATTQTSLILYYSSPKASPVSARHYEMRVTTRAPNPNVAGAFHVIDNLKMMTSNDLSPRPAGSTADVRTDHAHHTPASPLPAELPSEWGLASMDVESPITPPSRGDLAEMRRRLAVSLATICGLKNQRVADKEVTTKAVVEAAAETKRRIDVCAADATRLELLLGEERDALARSNDLLHVTTKASQNMQRSLDRARGTSRSDTAALRTENARLAAALQVAEAASVRLEASMMDAAFHAEAAQTSEGAARELQAEADEVAVCARVEEAVRKATEAERVAAAAAAAAAAAVRKEQGTDAALAKVRAQHETTLAQADEQHAADAAKVRAQHETTLAQVRERHEVALEEQKQALKEQKRAFEEARAEHERTLAQGRSDALVSATQFEPHAVWPQHCRGGWVDQSGMQLGPPGAYGTAYCQPVGPNGGGGWYGPASGGGGASNLEATVATMATCMAQLAQHVGVSGPDGGAAGPMGHPVQYAQQYPQQYAPYEMAPGMHGGSNGSPPHMGGRGGFVSGGGAHGGAKGKGGGGAYHRRA
jgi:hypothetical protein